MSQLPVLRPREVCRTLEKLGFPDDSSRGRPAFSKCASEPPRVGSAKCGIRTWAQSPAEAPPVGLKLHRQLWRKLTSIPILKRCPCIVANRNDADRQGDIETLAETCQKPGAGGGAERGAVVPVKNPQKKPRQEARLSNISR